MIFIDADAFIGSYKKSDPHHKNAVRISENLQETSVPFSTTAILFREVALICVVGMPTWVESISRIQ